VEQLGEEQREADKDRHECVADQAALQRVAHGGSIGLVVPGITWLGRCA
jgi:hypothetical protein